MPPVLTGSGSPDPTTDCPCARCRWAAAHEPPRAPLALGLAGGQVLDAGTPPAVVSAGGTSLLWAPGARLPELTSAVDVAVLTPAADDGSLTGVARAIARSRAGGTIGAGTRVVLAGLGHQHPRADRLAAVLAAWGVHRPGDGTDLGRLDPLPRLSGRTLVLGGASSGKSAHAEALLSAEPEVVYLATGPVPDAADKNWAAKVSAHRGRRPEWWRTIETPYAATAFDHEAPILLDAVGTWLTAALDEVAAWEQAAGWRDRLAARTNALVQAWRSRTGTLVAVAEEVGLGVIPATPAGRIFREELGRLNARLAAESDRVVLVVAGVATDIMVL